MFLSKTISPENLSTKSLSAGPSTGHDIKTRHPNMRFYLAANILTALIIFFCSAANAQTFTTKTIPLDGVNPSSYIAVDGSGNLYISTAGPEGSGVVEKATLSDGSYSVSNIWSQASTTANGVAVDSSGNAYLAAYDNGGGQCFGLLTPYSPSGLATVVDIENPNASLNWLNAAVTPSGATAYFNGGAAGSDIFVFGRLKNFQGGYDDGFVEENPIPVSAAYTLNSIAADTDGDVYVASGPSVFRETPNGSGYTQSTIYSGEPGFTVTAVAVDSSGDVYVSDYLNSRLILLQAGTYTQTIIATGYQIKSLAVDSDDNVYCVLSNADQSILEVSPKRIHPV